MELDRRAFLRGAAVAGGLAAFSGLTACTPQSSVTNQGSGSGGEIVGGTKYTKYPNPDGIGILHDTSSEESYDFVIVGSGITGLTAAMIAAEQMSEAKVLLIDKQVITGGSSNFAEIQSGGQPTTPEKAWQRAQDTAKASSYMKNPDLLYSLYMDGSKNGGWLFYKQGFRHDKTNLFYEGSSGEKWMAMLTDKINTDPVYSNIEVRLSTQANALLMEDDHTCIGVQVHATGSFDSFTNIRAKAILLATGGCSSNFDLLQYYTGHDIVAKGIGIGFGQDGDGFLLVEDTAHGKAKDIYPTGMFNNVKGFSFSSALGSAVAIQTTNCYVNEQGLRFLNEEEANVYAFAQTAKSIELFGKVYSIMGQNLKKHYAEEGLDSPFWYYYKTPFDIDAELEKHKDNEYVFQADTLEELADKIGVPKSAFVETIQTYDNRAKAGEGEPEFGKTAAAMIPLGDGPYYAFRLFSGIIQTNGGIRIDVNCRVVDPYFVPIKGLYAGGIAATGFNGEIYTGGTSQGVGSWSGSKVARYVVENVLEGTVSDDWFGGREYSDPPPNLVGNEEAKPLLGNDFE
jgi:fumarate reductase flavoprotein subunit